MTESLLAECDLQDASAACDIGYTSLTREMISDEVCKEMKPSRVTHGSLLVSCEDTLWDVHAVRDDVRLTSDPAGTRT